ncbi:DUF2630 family protein [Barrientosiimonas humi]|uniref:DUF2630 family protein n=1 Tax=Barrientosiimonas humi TaxID=999931 RepID=UPI00370D7EAA
MSDPDIHTRIKDLVDAEHQLRSQLGKGEISAADEQRKLADIERQLDQCWDLLRQRDAKREFGEPTSEAEVRPQSVVENYES